MYGYTQEFKEMAVKKFLSRGNRTVAMICKEIGASDNSIYGWIKEYGKTVDMKAKARSPQALSSLEKMQAVMEFESLAETEAGEYLRREGLTAEHLKQWKNIWEKALETNGDIGFTRAEKAELVRKVKELESDLTRKDKALAETTALLVLKKKADLIWGTLD